METIIETEKVPCGTAIITKQINEQGEIVQQDVKIEVSADFLAKAFTEFLRNNK